MWEKDNRDDNVSEEVTDRAASAAKSEVKRLSKAGYGEKLKDSKKAIQRKYAAAKRSEQAAAEMSRKAAGKTAEAVGTAGRKLTALKEKALSLAAEHPWLTVILSAASLLLLTLGTSMSSGAVLFSNSSGVVVATTFTAEDADIIGANSDNKALEAALRTLLGRVEADRPGYGGYEYELDEIGHDPYQLAAFLTVLYEDYTRSEVQETLQRLFEKQYQLVYSEISEPEPRTGDNETGEEYEEEHVSKKLKVTLKNRGLAYAISQLNALDEDQKERMAILLETKGNKAELFQDEAYVATGDVIDYQIPAEYLTDERFANMIREGEKYLGTPYVWGGSSPETGFDCSGFVSWVINHCGNGWSIGRQTAEGLRSSCVTIISASAARPGDLVFFQGTYDTNGASHVGIYVGDNMMLHCGNPIQYASLETPYMQEHLYCFGRIND